MDEEHEVPLMESMLFFLVSLLTLRNHCQRIFIEFSLEIIDEVELLAELIHTIERI